jgi:hypothetical protein
MSVPAQPFPLPQRLSSPLASVHHYWNDLIRAENEMPCGRREPVAAAGDELIHRLGANVTSKFADEVELHGPFEFFIAQASATVEARLPTWYSSRRGYARILLPTWGDGRIELLLGAIA